MSARKPGASATEELANIPVRSLKIKNDAQFGAKAQASVKRVKERKFVVIIGRRPNSSLRGAHNRGPIQLSVDA